MSSLYSFSPPTRDEELFCGLVKYFASQTKINLGLTKSLSYLIKISLDSAEHPSKLLCCFGIAVLSPKCIGINRIRLSDKICFNPRSITQFLRRQGWKRVSPDCTECKQFGEAINQPSKWSIFILTKNDEIFGNAEIPRKLVIEKNVFDEVNSALK